MRRRGFCHRERSPVNLGRDLGADVATNGAGLSSSASFEHFAEPDGIAVFGVVERGLSVGPGRIEQIAGRPLLFVEVLAFLTCADQAERGTLTTELFGHDHLHGHGYTGMMSQPTSQDLQALPLFGGLGPDALARFVERCEVMECTTGQVVFTEGEAARSLYVVQSGQLEIVKICGRGEMKLGTVIPGECVGEMSFIDMQPRSATVRAVEPSTLWVWAYASIHERYCTDLKCAMLLVMNIARELSRRLRRADELLVENTPSAAPSRVWPRTSTPMPSILPVRMPLIR